MVPAMLEQPPDFFHLFMNKSESHFAYTRYSLHFCTSFSSKIETRVLRVSCLALVLVCDLCLVPYLHSNRSLANYGDHLGPKTFLIIIILIEKTNYNNK
jgi:hypothetical protein